MANDDVDGEFAAAGRGPGPQVIAENRQPGGISPPNAPPKEPGWYPVRSTPNEQTYWDGRDWTRRRRWSAGAGWTDVGPNSVATYAVAAPGPRLSSNPYAPHPTATAVVPQRAPGVTLGILILIASAVAMMFGSVATWISSSSSLGSVLFGFDGGSGHTVSTAVSGVTDGVSGLIGINGYITLIAGAVVLVFAGLMAVSDELSVRLIGCLVALVSLGLSTYAVVRLAQKLNETHTPHGVTVNMGWGVILVLGAAVIATLMSLFEVTRNR
jgi:hypothetical protein